MSNPQTNEGPIQSSPQAEIMSAHFARMILQNTNMALMLLGQVPNPQSGETVRDLDAAQMFIDQLEMLEFKTKGNLSREEEKLLQQGLTHLRMAFVHAVENPPPQNAPKEQPQGTTPATPPAADTPETTDEEARKRFSKKY